MCISNQKSTESKLEPVITLDKTGAKRDLTHYIAIFFWIGWTSFYFFFVLTLPLLFIYFKSLLSVIVGAMIISALTPISRKSQPKVCLTHEIVA